MHVSENGRIFRLSLEGAGPEARAEATGSNLGLMWKQKLTPNISEHPRSHKDMNRNEVKKYEREKLLEPDSCWYGNRLQVFVELTYFPSNDFNIICILWPLFCHGGRSKRTDSPCWRVVQIPALQTQVLIIGSYLLYFIVSFCKQSCDVMWRVQFCLPRRLQGIRLESGSVVSLDSKELEADQSDHTETVNGDVRWCQIWCKII